MENLNNSNVHFTDGEVYELLKTISSLVSRTYWNMHNHCGSDFRELACDACNYYCQCKDEKRLTELLTKLKNAAVPNNGK
jgi:hypothetical protein